MTTSPKTPETRPIEKTRHAPRWKVFVHNDDHTPMEFVTYILMTIFSLKKGAAVAVMEEAHHTGVAFVGAYAIEQAEFRVQQAHSIARGSGFPLTFTCEPE